MFNFKTSTWPLLIIVASSAIFLVGVSGKLSEPLTGEHAFRQAQTALGARAILRGGLPNAFYYPALSPPWRLAFELPAFQAASAGIARVSKSDIIKAGRSLACFFALAVACGFATLVFILSRRPTAAAATYAGILLSPFLLKWSPAFLMESMVVASCVWSMVCLLLSKKHGFFFCLAAALMSLGMMVKITTGIPFLGAVILFAGIGFISRKQWKPVLCVIVLAAVSLACGVSWTKFADSVKADAGFAGYLTSTSPNMKSWNYGTWQQKTSISTWQFLLSRDIDANGGVLFAALFLLALAAIGSKGHLLRVPAAACFAGWLAGPMLFTNLHIEHTYYPLATVPLLLTGIAFAFTGVTTSEIVWRRTASASAVIFLSLYGYLALTASPASVDGYAVLKDAGNAINRSTKPSDIVVVNGADWNPVIAYYADRKTVMIPDWPYLEKRVLDDAIWQVVQEAQGIGFYLSIAKMPNSHEEWVLAAFKKNNIQPAISRRFP